MDLPLIFESLAGLNVQADFPLHGESNAVHRMEIVEVWGAEVNSKRKELGTNPDKKGRARAQGQGAGEGKETNFEDWVPLSVREARRARKMREDLWPYVWMTFASVILLASALVILSYRMGAQSCH